MKRKLRHRKWNKKRLIRLCCVLAVVYALVLIFDQEVRFKALFARRAETLHQLDEAKLQCETYDRQMEYVNSPDYIEREAHDKLGWVREGERIFIEKEQP